MIFIVLAHWNKSSREDMSLHSDTLFWFRANQSLLFLLNATCLAEKQQIPILYSLVWPTIYRTRGEHANHYATDTVSNLFFFNQNFLVSINILFENKNWSKTIRVTWYLYKMMFSHRHLTRLIMSGKVSGFVRFHIIFIEFRFFVLDNKILKINSTTWC